MSVSIYLDESGDLGWRFDLPYGKGGSSRYLTLAAVVAPSGMDHHLKRIVRGLYKKRKRSTKNELKSVSLSAKDRTQFANEVVSLKSKHPRFKFLAITVNKRHVNDQFRRHPNGLYNYMTKLLLLDEFATHGSVNFIPDSRSIRTELKHALDDYLRMELAVKGADTRLTTTPWDSKASLELQFSDFLAGIVWAKDEFSGSEHYNIVKDTVLQKRLFFP